MMISRSQRTKRRLADIYGWDDEQVSWRRNKIIDLSVGGSDGERSFKQEYPNTAAEAFQFTGGDGLITADDVQAARHRYQRPGSTLLVGIDPSRGGDRFAAMRRAGAKAWGYEKWVKDEVATHGQQIAICKKILDTVDLEANKKSLT